jgi:hypothetical protein
VPFPSPRLADRVAGAARKDGPAPPAVAPPSRGTPLATTTTIKSSARPVTSTTISNRSASPLPRPARRLHDRSRPTTLNRLGPRR